MQGIIESLSPEHSDIDWKWVGSVFVFYIVAMMFLAGGMMSH